VSTCEGVAKRLFGDAPPELFTKVWNKVCQRDPFLIMEDQIATLTQRVRDQDLEIAELRKLKSQGNINVPPQ
jgi:hypothetical protein